MFMLDSGIFNIWQADSTFDQSLVNFYQYISQLLAGYNLTIILDFDHVDHGVS